MHYYTALLTRVYTRTEFCVIYESWKLRTYVRAAHIPELLVIAASIPWITIFMCSKGSHIRRAS